jgi:chemotaxis protein MotB
MSEQPIIIKKKKAHEHAHHGGSWKVAYADFVTAMMAFFMVMWIMGLSDDSKAQISGYFNDPMGFLKNQPQSKTIISLPGMPTPRPGDRHLDQSLPHQEEERAARSLQREIQEVVTKGGVDLNELLKNMEFTLTEEGLRIEFTEAAGSVFFESGSHTLKPEARKLIASIAPLVKKANRPVVVEGHTDAVPFPGQAYTNWNLSTDRANAMARVLRECGVEEKLFRAISGYADTRPLRPDDVRHPGNRRVSLLLAFDLSEDDDAVLPGEELRRRIKSHFPPSP